MLTPQEVSEHSFSKASFGGYSMTMVDEFLDQVTEDYTTLYKENTVLKSKMKVLADKIEEYRSTEDAMRKTLLTAQRMADEMIKEAEEKQAALLAGAEETARRQIEQLRTEIAGEEQRLTEARATTAAYIEQAKKLCIQEAEYLEALAQQVAAAEDAPCDDAPTAEPDPIDLADTREMDPLEIAAKAKAAAEQPQEELVLTFPDKDGERERKMKLKPDHPISLPDDEQPEQAEDAPVHIDMENLAFGKDYEIK